MPRYQSYKSLSETEKAKFDAIDEYLRNECDSIWQKTLNKYPEIQQKIKEIKL